MMSNSEIIALHFSLHGAIILLLGFVSGIFFASAIKRGRGETAWRVVHAGGCMAGTMLLALSWPSRFIVLPEMLRIVCALTLISGTYLLVFGMFIAAIKEVRGIPGGGSSANRTVASLYAIGTLFSIVGSALLAAGLLGALW